MLFPETFLHEIRLRLPISGVVGKHVRLTRRGQEYLGICPFHEEKTPSFTISDDKGFYHCFGCGAHGDAFGFVMRTSGIDFMGAVERLAGVAGLELPSRERTPEQTKRAGKRERLLVVAEAAAEWFAAQVGTTATPGARQVMEQRGLAGETAAAFRLGLAPTGRATLKRAMLAGGFAEDELVAAGLLKRPDDGGESFDYFRNRIMFPIGDRRGRVVGFGGRTLGGERSAKYLNSPDTLLFHKGRTLYNLAGARRGARETGTVIVAEGYTDVIALWRAGYKHAVAPLGTALSETQMYELWRLAPEPVLCFDGDAAGWRAALRLARRALPFLTAGHSLRFAMLPDGEDPDSLLRGGRQDELETALSSGLPLSQVLWRSAAVGDLSTPERRAALRKELFGLATEIRDASVREYYRQYFAALLDRALGASHLRSRATTGRLRDDHAVRSRRPEHRLLAGHGLGRGVNGAARRREQVLLATLINHPEILPDILDSAVQVRLESAELDRLLSSILEIAGHGAPLDRLTLRRHLTDPGDMALADQLVGPGSGLVERFALNSASPEEAEAGWRETVALNLRAQLQSERESAARLAIEAGSESALERLRALHAEAIAEDALAIGTSANPSTDLATR